jgi:small-conductance mechanosensitive channel
MDERWVRALVTAAVWLVVIVSVRWLLGRAFGAWERRHAESDPVAVARRRTTFSFLARIVVALVAVIGAWSVLSIFPATTEIASALIASSAVLALVVGLALTTPLANLGSGVLVAFTQPIRLGDRVTIGDQTGFVEEIHLIYTTLVTDDKRRVFVPNTQLTTTAIVNRTIRDPRRAVTAALPVRLDAPIVQARADIVAAVRPLPGVLDARAVVSDVTDKLVWISVTAFAPLDADVEQVASDVREAGLRRLDESGLLPRA